MSCRYRVTVIRNLPQLQKLDNVTVQADEMADAMRRGVELIHPFDQVGEPQYQMPPQMPPPAQVYQEQVGSHDRDSMLVQIILYLRAHA